ncbi:MAG: IS3 family transposase, partial [bacterium]|nr:IS3 family transposase [bacterium]
ALWRANYGVYGARKLWKAARRAGIDVGRDQAARLMRLAGIEGARRRRRARAARPDPGGERPADLVERDFTAEEPNKLWVADPAYVATWAGVAYVCFIVDAFSRRIVGWRAAAHMRTSMALDALETARASRGTRLAGLVAHSDAGGQSASLRWGQRLAELGAAPSVGSVGDSYDNALAETVNGIYKTELIRGPAGGPWRTVGDVELATLAWVHRHNQQRLHSHLGDLPPAEFEAAYAARRTDHTLVGNQ